MKYTKFQDIPKFIQTGSWECTFGFTYFVDEIQTLMSTEDLQMNPDFQRGHVWTTQQQISFVETVLKGGAKNARTIYLNNPSWHSQRADGEYNDFVCVDGLQRYTAIKNFVENEIKVFNSYYKEYTDSMRTLFNMRINVNDLKSKKEVLEWYLQINDGGTPHTKDEIDKVKSMLRNEYNSL